MLSSLIGEEVTILQKNSHLAIESSCSLIIQIHNCSQTQGLEEDIKASIFPLAVKSMPLIAIWEGVTQKHSYLNKLCFLSADNCQSPRQEAAKWREINHSCTASNYFCTFDAEQSLN